MQLFVDNLLLKNGFKKENMKTRNFVIREENEYNNTTQKYEHNRYSYNQIAILKFDYDKELVANIMISIANLENTPMCQINFGIKEKKVCRQKILTKAYKDAEEQANIIASTAGKILKYCQKVDFNPITTNYISQGTIASNIMYAERTYNGATQTIINTFTPEDIELSETLYCLWIAE